MIRITLLLLLTSSACFSQVALPIPTNHKHAYASGTRSIDGLPGERYWQNSADYHIRVSFDPSTLLLSGTVSITYYNNSPDTLKKIQFKLYPNLYKAGAVKTMPIHPDDLTEGVKIKSLSIDNESVNANRIVTQGTNMFVGNRLIKPGDSVHVTIDYSYILNKGSFIRTGQVDAGSFFIAYFFPRIAVYDDIDGWNEYPYTGREEFYNDYGTFRCEITVPGDYLVWSTGDLVNAKEVLPKYILDRIDSANHSDKFFDIISESDYELNLRTKEQKTWLFEASDIPDMAFAISNHFVWKSTSVLVDAATQRRTQVNAVYDPTNRNFYRVIEYARQTVSLMSHQFPKYPFPYSHQTVVQGLDAMEYPMMVNYLPSEDEAQTVQLIAHEIFHTMFPFYVGFNESKYSFLDEGLATLTEFGFFAAIAPSQPMNYDISAVNTTAGADFDLPIVTLTPQLIGKARYSNKDLKPALGFHYIKEMLGDEKFSTAMRYVITTWKGKHPQPYDFFSSFNKGAQVNLNWFWQDWFYNKIAPDLAISKVDKLKNYTAIEIRKRGSGMVPVHLSILYTNGSKEHFSSTIAAWSNNNESVTYRSKSNLPIQEIRLGNEFDVDIDQSNNVWRKPGETK